MKWFKHDADASSDAKLKKLRLKYGAQGYGIYWYCIEQIARNVDLHNLTFELEHDAELIANDFNLSEDLVTHIMNYMVKIGLFENVDGLITCLKLAQRTDEYTQKILKKNSNLALMSRQSPDSVPTKSVLIEQKRTEEKRKPLYVEYAQKVKKEYPNSKDMTVDQIAEHFKKKKRTEKYLNELIEGLKHYPKWFDNVTKDFPNRKHKDLKTFLNQEAWKICLEPIKTEITEIRTYN